MKQKVEEGRGKKRMASPAAERKPKQVGTKHSC